MTYPVPLNLQFHGWLEELSSRKRRGEELRAYSLSRRASIKDLVESFGVPHTEVGRIVVDGEDVPFEHIIERESRVDIFPHSPPVDVLTPSLLRPRSLSAIRFLVDINVGKLAGKLRMAGFDTLYNPLWNDNELADVSDEKRCILITRDLMLLKRKKVTFGHLVREIDPKKQLVEIISYYGLADSVKPFSRCMRCNGLLAPVAKEEIVDQLEPLTKKYYQIFHRCRQCRQIYWSGSHRDAMVKDLEQLSW